MNEMGDQDYSRCMTWNGWAAVQPEHEVGNGWAAVQPEHEVEWVGSSTAGA